LANNVQTWLTSNKVYSYGIVQIVIHVSIENILRFLSFQCSLLINYDNNCFIYIFKAKPVVKYKTSLLNKYKRSDRLSYSSYTLLLYLLDRHLAAKNAWNIIERMTQAYFSHKTHKFTTPRHYIINIAWVLHNSQLQLMYNVHF